jgi:hypothetical protein
MDKSIYPGFQVITWFIVHPINYTAGSGGRGDFAGMEYIEGESVIWLIPGQVGHFGPGAQAEFRSCFDG